ncbi:MAG: PBP1A family penicillin-binding protein [Desulfobacteraceae bacterium]|jgi:penicillin-binding protein 1A
MRKRFFIWVAAAGLLCGISAGGLLALTRDLPQITALENFRPPAVTRIFSADQVMLAELFAERRDPVSIHQVPPMLKTALLATEDRRFYQHSGVDIKGLMRAIVKNVIKRRYAEGASTLTQQLAKTLFLTPRKTISRKVREALLALQLERRYTKDEILSLYLNQIYLGSGAYGIGAAARTYFGSDLSQLSLSQCALIAGLPKAPSRYSPLVNPDLAYKRRNIVLAQMLAIHAIDEQAYQEARNEPITTVPRVHDNPLAPHFIQHIKETLETAIGADLLYKGGLTVYTTLSFEFQRAAEEAVARGLDQLALRMTLNGLTNPKPQVGLTVLNVHTGGLMAMVGGRSDQQTGFNRVSTARRQPGSAFKPIVYALAVERGFEQNQVLLDAPVVFKTAQSEKQWQPHNFSQTYDGEISLRWCLAHSKNIPAVRLIEKLGPTSVVQFAQRLGVQSELSPNLSLALGTSEVTLLELTAAYAAFANGGKFIRPYGVSKVVGPSGDILWKARPEQRIAMSRIGAATITNMLEAVISEGTGRSARNLPSPLAGKTGTTNDFKDALFVGYSPKYAAGVWVGNDDATTLGPKETGARAALPIWIQLMRKIGRQQTQSYFDIPDELHQIYINPRTGARMDTGAPGAVPALVRRQSQ